MATEFWPAVVELALLGAIWLIFGWLGYALANQARFDRWTVPAVKKKNDLWFFRLCVAGGLITLVLAGIVLVIQAQDILQGK